MGNSAFHVIPEWLELIFLAFCLGTVVCRLWVLDAEQYPGIAREQLLARMWRLFTFSAAAMAVSSVGDLAVRAAEMSGQPLPAVGSILPTVIFHTHLGRVWLLRIAACGCLLSLLWAGRRCRDKGWFQGALLLLLGLIAMTKSASGHAADAGDFSMAETVDWLHLMAASVWGGGLMVLSTSVFPLAADPDAHHVFLARVGAKFSRIAGYAVGVMAITAFLNGTSLVGSVDLLWSSPYGWTVAVKVVLFLVLLTVGAYNRYAAVPLLQKRAGLDAAPVIIERFIPFPESYPVAREFVLSVRVEAMLIIVILLCAALLRHDVPARHLAHLQHRDLPAAGLRTEQPHH